MKGTRMRLPVSALVLFPQEDGGDSVVRLKESNKQNFHTASIMLTRSYAG
jgi:hypothetical protein